MNAAPWERQVNESAQAYEAFSLYRDMGVERNTRAVARELGKSTALIDRWSSRNKWVERIRAYDNDIARETRKNAIKARKEMLTRHINLAKALQKSAYEALKDLPADKLTPKDIKEYIKVATELERISRDLTETEPDSAELDDGFYAAIKSSISEIWGDEK